jgi:asparaginyl-tRNA synthetase
MDLAEEFLKYTFKYVLDRCLSDMEFFQQRIDDSVLATAENIINNQFTRLTYTEAISILEKSDQQFEYPVSWGLDLQSEHERYLAEEVFKKPVILTDYPVEIKAFYMRLNDDGKTVAAMDILAPKIGEIIGGSQREERLDVLEQRITAQGLDVADYWWYLDLRRYGTVPHAGFGLGFERLVQFMTGMANIRDVIPFPRAPMTVEF